MEKKNIAITVLIIALVASGVGNIVLAVMGTQTGPPDRSEAYILATSSGPATLEITDSWDSASNDVLEQVVETLFGYDLTDLDLPRVGILAESSWYEDLQTLHIKLREDITFHDGTDFDADAAKWNLDRLQYMINATGTNTGEVAHTYSLWMFPDGVTPIMKNITSDGLYNITINLNGAYAPFENTLAYINAGMLSPTAHAGDATSFLGLDDIPVGTGPYEYVSYTPDVEVRFKRYYDYWMTDQNGFKRLANFENVIYAIYDDATTAHNAFLSYTIDGNGMASDQNIEQYKTDPRFNVVEFTEDTGKPSLVYQYLGFNNQKINRTWREVFSYAFNYTYVIDELRLGNAFRAVSPISPGFGAAHNASLVPGPTPGTNAVPNDGDLAYARTVVQSMGFGAGLVGDAAWIAQSQSAPFFTVDYHFNTGNTFREDLGTAVNNWLNLVGCAVNLNGVTWSDFLNYLFDQYDVLGIFAIGWAPDYLDPYNMIDPLFNPVSSSNSGQVNDTQLMTLLGNALGETDTAARNLIYQEIQWYMATNGFFHAPLYHSKIVGVSLSNIYNIPWNAMGTLRIFPRFRGAWPAGV
jgi:ABC-type transport system substrate-binding protein